MTSTPPIRLRDSATLRRQPELRPADPGLQ